MDALIVMQIAGLVIGAAILGVMVYWTRILTRTLALARETTEAARAAWERQFQALSTPYLVTDFSAAAGPRVRVTVSNPGALPAFNVSLFIVAGYDEARTPRASFAQTYFREAVAGRWLEAAGGDGEAVEAPGTFGVACARHHDLIPPRRRIEYWMDLPVLPSTIHALVQHENVGGMNYACLWTFETVLTDDGAAVEGYGLAARQPQEVQPCEKIRFREREGRFALDDDAGDAGPRGTPPAGAALAHDPRFRATLRHAVPPHFLKREHLVFPGPPRWSDL